MLLLFLGAYQKHTLCAPCSAEVRWRRRPRQSSTEIFRSGSDPLLGAMLMVSWAVTYLWTTWLFAPAPMCVMPLAAATFDPLDAFSLLANIPLISHADIASQQHVLGRHGRSRPSIDRYIDHRRGRAASAGRVGWCVAGQLVTTLPSLAVDDVSQPVPR